MRVVSAAGVLCLLAPSASAQLIAPTRKIVAPAIDAMDRFGHSVATDGSVALVGAIFADGRRPVSGSAFLFDVDTGTLINEMNGNDTQPEDNFANSVTLAGGLAFAGAPFNETFGQFAGTAYVFNQTNGNQIQRLRPERIIFIGEDPVGSFFGWSIDASDDWLAIGAPGDVEGANGGGGAVYIYNAITRDRVGKFFASDAGFADNLGRSVAAGENVVVAGSPFDDDRGIDSGSIYVFDASTGAQLHKISPDDGARDDLFGLTLDIDGDVIVVGAPFADAVGTDSGAVYLFDANTGQQIRKIVARETSQGDQFGSSVAIHGNLVAVGARSNDLIGDVAGAAYVFDVNTGQQIATLLADDGESGDVLGSAISISARTVLVGAEGDDDLGDFAGAAYIFTVPEIDPSSCSGADLAAPFRTVNFFDVIRYIELFNQGSSQADFALPLGSIDFFDIAAFLQIFQSGCP